MFLFFQQFEVQSVLILFLYAINAKLHNFNTFSDRVENLKEIQQYMYIVQYNLCYSVTLVGCGWNIEYNCVAHACW